MDKNYIKVLPRRSHTNLWDFNTIVEHYVTHFVTKNSPWFSLSFATLDVYADY
jgi:hypothetical protein